MAFIMSLVSGLWPITSAEPSDAVAALCSYLLLHVVSSWVLLEAFAAFYFAVCSKI